MANDTRTQKRCYESRYGGGWIAAGQRLAEMACERIAGPNTLGVGFWRNKPWSTTFMRELTFANRLLATPFAFEAIARAWVSRDGQRVRSLGAPFFRPTIEREQKKLEMEAESMEQAILPESVNTLETPRPMKRASRSIREKLADNGPKQQNE